MCNSSEFIENKLLSSLHVHSTSVYEYQTGTSSITHKIPINDHVAEFSSIVLFVNVIALTMTLSLFEDLKYVTFHA